jgi:hypothetical protein
LSDRQINLAAYNPIAYGDQQRSGNGKTAIKLKKPRFIYNRNSPAIFLHNNILAML